MKIKSSHYLSLFVATSALIVTQTPLVASEADDQIESSAKSSFVFRTFLKDDSVKTKSENGAVTLTGTVAYAFHKALAQDTVESLPDVKSVNNLLTVVKEGSTDDSDKALSQRVKTVLMFHRNLNGRKTDVSAKDGNITLKGTANSEAQKDLSSEYAKDVEGVKNVSNEMTVAESKAEPDRTISEKIDDASITAQIKASLLTHRSTSAMKTHIETRSGVVTVSGIAANAAEKALVSKLIGDIDGVVSVTNNMTVRETASSGN